MHNLSAQAKTSAENVNVLSCQILYQESRGSCRLCFWKFHICTLYLQHFPCSIFELSCLHTVKPTTALNQPCMYMHFACTYNQPIVKFISVLINNLPGKVLLHKNIPNAQSFNATRKMQGVKSPSWGGNIATLAHMDAWPSSVNDCLHERGYVHMQLSTTSSLYEIMLRP